MKKYRTGFDIITIRKERRDMRKSNLENMVAVIRYMEAHLSEKLDLDRIAGAVHYSKYHLHRTFTRTVGLTLHEYLQRRRLTEAAKLLVFSDRPVLEIAMLSGYESQQAFTNVFTALYKTPPGRYREQEKFYPLQLRYHFEKECRMQQDCVTDEWEIEFAKESDTECWMDLVRLVISGFPCFHEEEYREVLREKVRTGQALILKDRDIAIGIMLFTYETGSIDFMGSHPLYRNRGIPQAFLDKAMGELMKGKEISITTYREGDRADTGQRKEIRELGFAEAELLVEYGYPTQRFTRKEESDE